MGRFLLLLLAFIPFLSAAEKPGRVSRHWFIEADFVYYKIGDVSDRSLVEIGHVAPTADPSLVQPCSSKRGDCPISTESIEDNFHHEPGLRAAIGYRPNQKFTFELTYTGLLKWDAKQSTSCFQSLHFPFAVNNTSDFIYADSARVIYDSNLNTGSFNFWYHWVPKRVNYFSVSALFGLCFVAIDEKMKTTFFRFDRQSDYNSKTWNRLFALQLGGDFEVHPVSWFYWGLEGRFGMGLNVGRQHTKLRDFNNRQTLRDTDTGAFNLGIVLEGHPYIRIAFTDNFFLNVSYEAFFVDQIALAAAQYGFSGSGKRVQNGGHILYHGGIVGLTLEF